MAVYVQLQPRIMTRGSEAGVPATVLKFWGKLFPEHGSLDGNTFDTIKTNFELYFENLLSAQMVPIYKHNYEQLREYQQELNQQVLEQNAKMQQVLEHTAKMQELHKQYLNEIHGIHTQLVQIQANTKPKSLLPTMFRKTGVPHQA